MSADPTKQRFTAHQEQELIELLIATLRLSDDQVVRIKQFMVDRCLGFADAAVYLDIITAREAAEILERTERSMARADSNVVETALRRQQLVRISTVQHTAIVKPSRQLLLLHDSDHPHCERVRALRTELLLQLDHAGRQGNAIALLSPAPSEGRSQLSADLAIAFAQLGRRTLLIDTDLRRPRQHVLFGAGRTSGIAQHLAGSEPMALLGVEGLPHLSLLPAGPAPPNPLEMLSDGRFERLLAGWRRDYDFLVLDTPAVTRYSDGLAIASLAEQVLIVSRANATSHKGMKETLRRLASTRARLLGAVINNF